MLERQVKRVQWSLADRMILAALRERLHRTAWSALLVQPDTVLGWHRELVGGINTAESTGVLNASDVDLVCAKPRILLPVEQVPTAMPMTGRRDGTSKIVSALTKVVDGGEWRRIRCLVVAPRAGP